MTRLLRSASPLRAARRLAFLGFVALALGGTGCVSKPVVSVHHAELAGASFNGVTMNVILQVKNDNSYDVQIRSVNVQAVLQGKYSIGPLAYSPNVWLPADQTTLVTVPLVIPWALIPPLISETLGSDTVSYKVHGTADVTATRLLAVQRNDYPVDEDGTMPRQMLVAAASRGMMPF